MRDPDKLFGKPSGLRKKKEFNDFICKSINSNNGILTAYEYFNTHKFLNLLNCFIFLQTGRDDCANPKGCWALGGKLQST